MVRVSSDNTNPNGGGGALLTKGSYHLCIDDAFVNNDGDVECKITALAGTPTECVGRSQKEWFKLEGVAAGRLWKLLVATRIVTQADWERAAAEKSGLDFDEAALKGRQFVGVFEDETYNGKTNAKLGFRIFALDDEEVAKVPKDKEFYDLWISGQGGGDEAGGTAPVGAGTPNGSGGGGADPFDAFA